MLTTTAPVATSRETPTRDRFILYPESLASKMDEAREASEGLAQFGPDRLRAWVYVARTPEGIATACIYRVSAEAETKVEWWDLIPLAGFEDGVAVAYPAYPIRFLPAR